jgi:hypothetical protein
MKKMSQNTGLRMEVSTSLGEVMLLPLLYLFVRRGKSTAYLLKRKEFYSYNITATHHHWERTVL